MLMGLCLGHNGADGVGVTHDQRACWQAAWDSIHVTAAVVKGRPLHPKMDPLL